MGSPALLRGSAGSGQDVSPPHYLHLSVFAFFDSLALTLCSLGLPHASAASESSKRLSVWLAGADAPPQGRAGASRGQKPVPEEQDLGEQR